MAIAPDRVEPVFGDALAGGGGMTEPPPTGARRDSSFDVFPDALSALPLPALTFVVAPESAAGGFSADLPGVPVGLAGTAARTVAPTRPAAGRAPARPANPARPAPPTGPAWSGYPPPGQPPAVQPPAPGTGRRAVAGAAYTPPVMTASSVVRPPAYLPQNQGMAGFRTAVQQARGGSRTPASPTSASPTSAVRPALPTGPRRRGRASSAWALFVFALLFLVASGVGQNLLDALSRLLHQR